MFGADLRGAELSGARDLTAQQLQHALTDTGTVLPNGSRGPYMKFSGAENLRSRAGLGLPA